MPDKPRHAMYLTDDLRSQPEDWQPGRGFDWLIFTDKNTGKKVMVIHGGETGSFQEWGSNVVEKESPDIIHCCHPWQVARITGNRKIMFSDSKKTFYVGSEFIKGKEPLRMIRIFESKIRE
jgi:hypothetical protein